MIRAIDCYTKYGAPEANTRWLTIWRVPEDLQVGVIPRRIYCNKDMVEPLCEAFCNIKERGLSGQLITWDGCYNVRPVRGYEREYDALIKADRQEEAAQLLSIHSWGAAIDINAFQNRLGQVPMMSPELVACFTDAGFDWGGHWQRPDGMHFQLASI